MRKRVEASLVFVGGIHGTGKSTLCEQLAAKFGLHWVTASSLISHVAQPGDATGKAVDNVDDNQRRLVGAITQLRLQESSIILDGHYSLLQSNGNIAPIPVSTFELINPDLLVLLDAPATTVASRLARRDGGSPNHEKIEHFLRVERDHALAVAHALALSLVIASGPNAFSRVAEAIRKVVSRGS